MKRKNSIMAVILSFAIFMLTACGSYPEESTVVTAQSENTGISVTESIPEDESKTTNNEEKISDGMQITIGDKQFSVTTEQNETVTALEEMLPISLDMSELNGNEKYYYLDTALPTAPENVGHIKEGDIMLYGDSCIVVFYESFDTSYTYTKIGHIDDTSGLLDALGKGRVTVTFEYNGGSTAHDYTIQDVCNLQDFLLAKPTAENLVGKPYDLNGDDRWDVFDLCLMKQEIMRNRDI